MQSIPDVIDPAARRTLADHHCAEAAKRISSRLFRIVDATPSQFVKCHAQRPQEVQCRLRNNELITRKTGNPAPAHQLRERVGPLLLIRNVDFDHLHCQPFNAKIIRRLVGRLNSADTRQAHHPAAADQLLQSLAAFVVLPLDKRQQPAYKLVIVSSGAGLLAFGRTQRQALRCWGLVLACLKIIPLGSTAYSADWPIWSGPDHNGISSVSGWLDHWPDGRPKVAWKASVGTGFSGFCVAAGRVYTAGNADNTDTFFCFDAESGKPLWKYSYPADLGDKYFEGGPTATAAAEGGHSYFCSRWGDVFCFEAATGKVIWQTNIHTETGCRIPDWGFAGSPLLFKDRVVLNICEAGVALDKATGKIIWKSGRKESGYSTPLPVEFNGQPLALFANYDSYLAVNLETGKQLWHVRWLTQGGINVADPLVSGDKFLISSGYGKGSQLLQMTDADPTVIWKNREPRHPHQPRRAARPLRLPEHRPSLLRRRSHLHRLRHRRI